jgi:hypothetical protein
MNYMRRVWILAVVMLMAAGLGRADAQVSVQAGGGPTLIDTGYDLSAEVGVSPASRITFLGGIERTHLASQIEFGAAPGGRQVVTSSFRGGTMTAATGTLRVSLFPSGRPTPYALAGFGIGQSRPTVNERYPDAVTNDARFLMVGAGMNLPLREHLSLFGDARMLFGAEGTEGILAIVPIRAGISWRF